MRHFAAVLLALSWVVGFPQSAQAQKRIALLIGNQSYQQAVGPLRNPHNDIRIVSDALAKVDFDVLALLKDARRHEILLAVRDFADKLKDAGPEAIGFLYYAVHGVASEGQNYLIPVDVEQPNSRMIGVMGVTQAEILNTLKTIAPEALHYLVFDACRNNLGGGRGPRGFEPIRARGGVLIAFAAEPGATASDEGDKAGPYATALAAELVKSGQTDLEMFNGVGIAVRGSTRGDQTPWVENGILRQPRVQFGISLAKAAEPLLPPLTSAARAPEVECDRLAAFADDPEAVVRGVKFDEIQAEPAKRACSLARSQYPAEMRFVFQLARAYLASQDPTPAKELLEQLAANGYLAAFNGLGFTFIRGIGVAKDRAVA